MQIRTKKVVVFLIGNKLCGKCALIQGFLGHPYKKQGKIIPVCNLLHEIC